MACMVPLEFISEELITELSVFKSSETVDKIIIESSKIIDSRFNEDSPSKH